MELKSHTLKVGDQNTQKAENFPDCNSLEKAKDKEELREIELFTLKGRG